MDLFVLIDRIVATLGHSIDVMAVLAWMAVFFTWEQTRQYRVACKVASDRGVPAPRPNAWIIYSRPVFIIACVLLWLAMIHWGQVQQKPIRG